MPREILTFGHIKNGKLSIVDRAKFSDALLTMKDGEVELVVKAIQPKRSDPANRYHFGVIVPIAMRVINEEWGTNYGKVKIHEILKEHNNQVDHETSSGRIIRITRDTHDMPHDEFCAFVERCRQMLWEFFGVETPDPEKITNSKNELKV